jgi:DNA-binding CsgD family transcriptional regulator
MAGDQAGRAAWRAEQRMVPLLDALERLDDAPDGTAAWAVGVSALQDIGVEWCFHGHVGALPSGAGRPTSVLHRTNLPEAWQRHRAERAYWRVDASIRHCRRSVAVMLTGLEFAQAADDAGWARMCADAQEAGIGCGLAIPLRGAQGAPFGGFALLTRTQGAAFAAWRAAHGRSAVVMAHAIAQRLLALAEVEQAAALPRLSPRERECLLWLAQGLRSDRIAERLGLSRATVDLHLLRARRRLSAATREQALARALVLGLLEP